MSHYKANVRDLEFNLFEGLDLEKALATGEFRDLDGAYYRGKVAAAVFFADTVLPRVAADRVVIEFRVWLKYAAWFAAVSYFQTVSEPDTDSSVEKALAGGAPQQIGWYRFYFGDERWEWSDEVAVLHGYRPATVTPTTELVLAHKHPDDYAQVAATLDDIRPNTQAVQYPPSHHHRTRRHPRRGRHR